MAQGWIVAMGSALAVRAGGAAAQPGEVIPFPKTPPAAAGAQGPAAPVPPCAPLRLTRMVVRNISPNLQAAAPAAQPRTLYRKGSTLLRSEESPDPSRNVHAVVVISEPDVWAMNMATRTGQHSVDPGPELNVHAPILPVSADAPPPMMGLEFGCEPEFVAQFAPQPRQVVAWGAERALVHALVRGDHALTLIMRDRSQAPLMVVYARAGKPVFAVRYDEWRADLPDRRGLFEPPQGVRFTEAPVAKPAPAKPTT